MIVVSKGMADALKRSKRNRSSITKGAIGGGRSRQLDGSYGVTPNSGTSKDILDQIIKDVTNEVISRSSRKPSRKRSKDTKQSISKRHRGKDSKRIHLQPR